MIVGKNSLANDYINLYSLAKVKIGIPIFQRFYAWKKEQVIKLKEDILSVISDMSKQLYLLDIIYYKEDDVIKVADGQQRIITLNNLIKAINDLIDEQQLSINKIKPFDVTYDIVENNAKYVKHMTSVPVAPFKAVYIDLKEFVQENINNIQNIIYVIENNIYVYAKTCTNPDEAFEIFQQINTGGKPLTKNEIIKTAIDQYSTIYGIKYDTKKIKDVQQAIISFYKYKMNNFDKKFDNMEIITFLRDYITKDKTTFQEFTDASLVLSKVSESSIAYVIRYINRTTLFDVLNVLSMKGIDVSRNAIWMQELMIPLCLASICLTLNNGSPTTFRYLLSNVITDIKNDIKPTAIKMTIINTINTEPAWKITLDKFTEKLGDLSVSRNLKKALLILDVIYRNTSGSLNVDTINLEHIYPQNPDSDWAANGWPTSREDQKVLIDNIGNYLLLAEVVNKSIQNEYITNKVKSYEEIIAKDKLLQTSMNTADFKLFEKDREKYIKYRQTEIAKMVQNDLPLGKVLII